MTTRSLPALVLLLAMISQASPQLQADNWPGWRGSAQDGHTSETNIPVQWSASDNVRWKTPISGVGHSSPIVWEDAIFVTTCDTDQLSRRLLKVQRESGTVEWDIEIAVSPIEKMHRDNTPASATPITDGQHVFVVFMVNDGLEVTAVNFAGEKVWKRRVGEFESAHGFCTNLVLDGDRLFLSGLQDGPDAFIASLDKNTGDILWKVPRTKQVRSFSTPYLCTIQDQPALLLSGAEQTAAYNRDTGETIWEIDGPGSKTVSSVVACNESHLAFVCGGRDNLFYALGMRGTETSDSKLPTVAWESKKGIPYMTSPLLSNGKLHILSDEGVYRCYDPATGKVLKELRAVGPVKSSMIANKDHIYITEVSGRTTVIKNDATWTVVAENDLNEEVVASPAVSDGMLVFRTASHLVAIADRLLD